MVLAIAGGVGKVHFCGWKSDLCGSLELSQAKSQAQPENLLPSVISSAVTQMLQDLALCLTEREFCPWGGWGGTATQPPPFTCTSDTHARPLLLPSPNATRLLLMSWRGVTSTEVFSTGQKTSQLLPSLPQTPSAANQTLTELCVLKSDANLSTAEIFDR